MNLEDCSVVFSDSLVLPQQVKTRSGVGLWWRRNWERKGKITLALNRDMEEKEIVAVCGRVAELLLLQWEKDVYSRQLSVHFGSMSFLRHSVVLSSRS